MTEKNIEANSGKSYLILSIGVLIIGMFLFYYYSDVRLFYRVVGMITVLILSVLLPIKVILANWSILMLPTLK